MSSGCHQKSRASKEQDAEAIKWDHAKELEKMADILLRGSAAARSLTAARHPPSEDGSAAGKALRSQDSVKLAIRCEEFQLSEAGHEARD
jgi:hypothetical protein